MKKSNQNNVEEMKAHVNQLLQQNKDLVIIAQTTHALSSDREKAMMAGCDDNISKPINRDELITMIENKTS